jgi:hypothetical protein
MSNFVTFFLKFFEVPLKNLQENWAFFPFFP